MPARILRRSRLGMENNDRNLKYLSTRATGDHQSVRTSTGDERGMRLSENFKIAGNHNMKLRLEPEGHDRHNLGWLPLRARKTTRSYESAI